MKKKLIDLTAAPMHWIAAPSARNDVLQPHYRHCEGVSPWQSSALGHKNPHAFSLIELLVSLIIISLIATAFSPILIKKFTKGDIALQQAGVISYNQRTYGEDSEWEVPTRVRRIKVTSIAAGGGGGSASYGAKEITSTQNWVVPEGVTKIKVYLTGAGGGGAQGIKGRPYTPATGGGTGTKYGSLPALSSTTATITTAGTHAFTSITPPSNYKAPALASGCTGNWSYNGLNIAPNVHIPSFSGNTSVTITNVKACGGGGAGASKPNSITFNASKTGGTGGSGGYINKNVYVNAIASNISMTVGSGGGAVIDGSNNFQKGGSGAVNGSDASNETINTQSGGGWPRKGSGGGGSTAIYNSYSKIAEAPGGGGGAGIGVTSNLGGDKKTCSSNGGNGGGEYAGQGGVRFCIVSNGGGNYTKGKAEGNNGIGGAGGGTGAGAGTSGSSGSRGSYTIAADYAYVGGSGGGGIGGVGGSNVGGVLTNSVFSSNNCSGGNRNAFGKPGAIQITYSVSSLSNALSCSYTIPSTPAVSAVDGRGGGGGGAGQVWVGEIDVVKGQTVTFNIGQGGSSGANGGVTSVAVNGVIKATANGGRAGSGTSGGSGGGFSAPKNWLNINSSSGSGGSASLGSSGGSGGATYSKNNIRLLGGASDTDAVSSNYGAGGGGGSATQTSAQSGGRGANGYAYVEYANYNGGGGASGTVTRVETLSVTPGAKIEITVGKGGSAPAPTNPSAGVYEGKAGNSGGDSYITIAGVKYAYSYGGKGGSAGMAPYGTGGACGSGNMCGVGGNANANRGGIGGSITSSICSICDPIRGLGGCGGNMPNGNCYNALPTPYGKTATAGGGAGGGGGAVSNGVAYQGGYGANGTVIIEWN